MEQNEPNRTDDPNSMYKLLHYANAEVLHNEKQTFEIEVFSITSVPMTPLGWKSVDELSSIPQSQN